MTKRVSIVAMGSSRADFIAGSLTAQVHVRQSEVWGINHMGILLNCDRVIAMDPLDFYADPECPVFVDRDKKRFKALKCPIVTCYPDPAFPTSVAFPLQEVVKDLGLPYFNTSVAYALALAIYEKFDEIGLYGCDFTYPNLHEGEKGRACVEYWIGRAMARGIVVHIANGSSLMDRNVNFENGTKLYGYPDNPMLKFGKEPEVKDVPTN